MSEFIKDFDFENNLIFPAIFFLIIYGFYQFITLLAAGLK